MLEDSLAFGGWVVSSPADRERAKGFRDKYLRDFLRYPTATLPTAELTDSLKAEDYWQKYYSLSDEDREGPVGLQLGSRIRSYWELPTGTSEERPVAPEPPVRGRELSWPDALGKGLMVGIPDFISAAVRSTAVIPGTTEAVDDVINAAADWWERLPADQVRADLAATRSLMNITKDGEEWWNLDIAKVPRAIKGLATAAAENTPYLLATLLPGTAIARGLGQAKWALAHPILTKWLVQVVPALAVTGASEAGRFYDWARDNGVPLDIAERHARTYGVGGGIAETAQNMLTATFFKGTVSPTALKNFKLWSGKKIAKGFGDVVLEGAEGLGQEALWHLEAKNAIAEAKARDPGWKPIQEEPDFGWGRAMSAWGAEAGVAGIYRMVGLSKQILGGTIGQRELLEGAASIFDNMGKRTFTTSSVAQEEGGIFAHGLTTAFAAKKTIFGRRIFRDAYSEALFTEARGVAEAAGCFSTDVAEQKAGNEKLGRWLAEKAGVIVADTVQEAEMLAEMDKKEEIFYKQMPGQRRYLAGKQDAWRDSEDKLRVAAKYAIVLERGRAPLPGEGEFDITPEDMMKPLGLAAVMNMRPGGAAAKKKLGLMNQYVRLLQSMGIRTRFAAPTAASLTPTELKLSGHAEKSSMVTDPKDPMRKIVFFSGSNRLDADGATVVFTGLSDGETAIHEITELAAKIAARVPALKQRLADLHEAAQRALQEEAATPHLNLSRLAAQTHPSKSDIERVTKEYSAALGKLNQVEAEGKKHPQHNLLMELQRDADSYLQSISVPRSWQNFVHAVAVLRAHLGMVSAAEISEQALGLDPIELLSFMVVLASTPNYDALPEDAYRLKAAASLLGTAGLHLVSTMDPGGKELAQVLGALGGGSGKFATDYAANWEGKTEAPGKGPKDGISYEIQSGWSRGRFLAAMGKERDLNAWARGRAPLHGRGPKDEDQWAIAPPSGVPEGEQPRTLFLRRSRHKLWSIYWTELGKNEAGETITIEQGAVLKRGLVDDIVGEKDKKGNIVGDEILQRIQRAMVAHFRPLELGEPTSLTELMEKVQVWQRELTPQNILDFMLQYRRTGTLALPGSENPIEGLVPNFPYVPSVPTWEEEPPGTPKEKRAKGEPFTGSLVGREAWGTEEESLLNNYLAHRPADRALYETLTGGRKKQLRWSLLEAARKWDAERIRGPKTPISVGSTELAAQGQMLDLSPEAMEGLAWELAFRGTVAYEKARAVARAADELVYRDSEEGTQQAAMQQALSGYELLERELSRAKGWKPRIRNPRTTPIETAPPEEIGLSQEFTLTEPQLQYDASLRNFLYDEEGNRKPMAENQSVGNYVAFFGVITDRNSAPPAAEATAALQVSEGQPARYAARLMRVMETDEQIVNRYAKVKALVDARKDLTVRQKADAMAQWMAENAFSRGRLLSEAIDNADLVVILYGGPDPQTSLLAEQAYYRCVTGGTLPAISRVSPAAMEKRMERYRRGELASPFTPSPKERMRAIEELQERLGMLPVTRLSTVENPTYRSVVVIPQPMHRGVPGMVAMVRGAIQQTQARTVVIVAPEVDLPRGKESSRIGTFLGNLIESTIPPDKNFLINSQLRPRVLAQIELGFVAFRENILDLYKGNLSHILQAFRHLFPGEQSSLVTDAEDAIATAWFYRHELRGSGVYEGREYPQLDGAPMTRALELGAGIVPWKDKRPLVLDVGALNLPTGQRTVINPAAQTGAQTEDVPADPLEEKEMQAVAWQIARRGGEIRDLAVGLSRSDCVAVNTAVSLLDETLRRLPHVGDPEQKRLLSSTVERAYLELMGRVKDQAEFARVLQDSREAAGLPATQVIEGAGPLWEPLWIGPGEPAQRALTGEGLPAEWIPQGRAPSHELPRGILNKLHPDSATSLKLGDITYPSIWHAYYSALCDNEVGRIALRESLMSGKALHRLSRRWKTRKDAGTFQSELMRVVLHRWLENPARRDALLATEGMALTVNSEMPNWGWRENRLGQLMMDIRDDFLAAERGVEEVSSLPLNLGESHTRTAETLKETLGLKEKPTFGRIMILPDETGKKAEAEAALARDIYQNSMYVAEPRARRRPDVSEVGVVALSGRGIGIAAPNTGEMGLLTKLAGKPEDVVGKQFVAFQKAYWGRLDSQREAVLRWVTEQPRTRDGHTVFTMVGDPHHQIVAKAFVEWLRKNELGGPVPPAIVEKEKPPRTAFEMRAARTEDEIKRRLLAEPEAIEVARRIHEAEVAREKEKKAFAELERATRPVVPSRMSFEVCSLEKWFEYLPVWAPDGSPALMRQWIQAVRAGRATVMRAEHCAATVRRLFKLHPLEDLLLQCMADDVHPTLVAQALARSPQWESVIAHFAKKRGVKLLAPGSAAALDSLVTSIYNDSRVRQALDVYRPTYKEMRKQVNEAALLLAGEGEYVRERDNYMGRFWRRARPRQAGWQGPQGPQQRMRVERVFSSLGEMLLEGHPMPDVGAENAVVIWAQSAAALLTRLGVMGTAFQITSGGERGVIPVFHGPQKEKGPPTAMTRQPFLSRRWLERGGGALQTAAQGLENIIRPPDLAPTPYKWVESPYGAYAGFWVHPDIHPTFKRIFSERGERQLHGLMTAVHMSKAARLSFSPFFLVNTLESLLADVVGGWTSTGKRNKYSVLTVKQLLKADPELAARLARHGVEIELDSSVRASDVRQTLQAAGDIAGRLGLMGKPLKYGMKALERMYAWNAKWVWGNIIPASKVTLILNTYEAARNEAEQAGKSAMFEQNKDAIFGRLCRYSNMGIGGISWEELAWASPMMRLGLSLGFLAPNFTFSNLMISGLPDILEAMGMDNPLAQARTSTELRAMTERYWPGMMLLMFGIPMALQAAVYLTAGNREEKDELWNVNNELGRAGHVDITPWLRAMRKHYGVGDQGVGGGERRYWRLGKQVREVGGWLGQSMLTFRGKAGPLVTLAIDIATGLRGDPFTGREPEPFWKALSKSVPELVTPFTFQAVSQGNPLAFLIPSVKGMTLSKGVHAMRKVLATYADSGVTAALAGHPEFAPKLDRLVEDVAEACQRNGIPLDTVMKSATQAARDPHYTRLFNALVKGENKTAETAAIALIRLGAVQENVDRMIDNRLDRRGADYDPVTRRHVEGVVDRAYEALDLQKPTPEWLLSFMRKTARVHGGSKYVSDYLLRHYGTGAYGTTGTLGLGGALRRRSGGMSMRQIMAATQSSDLPDFSEVHPGLFEAESTPGE